MEKNTNTAPQATAPYTTPGPGPGDEVFLNPPANPYAHCMVSMDEGTIMSFSFPSFYLLAVAMFAVFQGLKYQPNIKQNFKRIGACLIVAAIATTITYALFYRPCAQKNIELWEQTAAYIASFITLIPLYMRIFKKTLVYSTLKLISDIVTLHILYFLSTRLFMLIGLLLIRNSYIALYGNITFAIPLILALLFKKFSKNYLASTRHILILCMISYLIIIVPTTIIILLDKFS